MLKNIIRNTVIFSVLLLLAGILLFSTVLKPWFLPVYLFLFVLFISVTIAYSAILVRAAERKPGKFISFFMGATAVKFFLYFSVMVVYILLDREHAIPFLLTFLLLYFGYTALAIVQTLKAIQNGKNRN